MGISIKIRNDRDKASEYCISVRNKIRNVDLKKYGIRGVNALRSMTPVDTGKTSESWSYKIERFRDHTKISFFNSNMNDGVNIALLIQYGHATRSGSWVEGIDYINPAIASIFKDMSEEVWKEVINQ